jgi:DNA repair protein RadC
MAPRSAARGDCPREAALCGRVDTLSDAALVGLLVSEGSEDAGQAVLLAHPIPDAFWRLTADELVRVLRPLGDKKSHQRRIRQRVHSTAQRLLACVEMSRRAGSWATSARPTVSTPEDVVALCGLQMRGLDREHFWMLALNTKNRLLRIVEVSVGSLNASIVHPRELFKEAVRLSAASVVVVHNHPSGDPTPSGADLQLTRRLVRAGEVLGIDLVDHVVIGDGGSYASVRDMGAL